MIVTKKFNDLTTNELYSILQLRSQVFVVEQNCIYQDIDGNDLNSVHMFILEDKQVVSYVRIVSLSNHTSIGRVVTDASHRGKGYSRELMNKAIDYIYELINENKIIISAQKYLEAFYSSLGFTSEGNDYLEDGIPHIRMIHKKKTP